jgi:hypothetical protein
MISKLSFSIVFLFAIQAFGQVDDGFWSVPQRENETDHYRQLWERAVVFENGCVPFQENKKWGMEDHSGKIVLAATYDSLLPSYINECVAVKNGKYQVLNEDFLPVFSEDMNFIEHDNGEYTLTDKNELRNSYRYVYNNTINAYELVPAHWNTKNYLINRPKPVKKPELNVKHIWSTGENNLITFTTFEVIEGTNLSICKLFNGAELYKAFNVETDEAKYLGGFYFLSGSKSKQTGWVIDIRNMDTVLTLPRAELSYFENNGEAYFLQKHLSEKKESTTVIISLQRDTVFQKKGDYNYQSGLLLKQSNDTSSNLVELYSFPERELLQADVITEHFTEDCMLLRRNSTDEHLLYKNGRQIYSFCTEGVNGILHPDYPGNDPVIAVQYENSPQTYRTDIITNRGKLIYSTDYLAGFDFNKEFNQICLITEDHDGMHYAVYDERNECFHFSVPNPEYFHQVAPNILYYTEIEYSNNGAGLQVSLVDFDGNCLKEQLFNGVRSFSLNGKSFLMTYDGTGLVAYTENLDTICSNCWINEIWGQYETKPNREFIALSDRSTNRIEILDENLKRVLPETYLAAWYFEYGDFFAVVKDDLEIEYIRYSDTEYSKKK